jgi:L-histidine Nalpha-methyltransferase
LGTDLLKPIPDLLDAYDDALGVTAAFNRNLLVRINRELDGDFVLEQFQHLAKFNPRARSVEMHLLSTREQTVTIPAAGFSVRFRAGETIWTESSHKYSRDEIFQLARDTGFRCEAQWVDTEWPFAESLLVAE